MGRTLKVAFLAMLLVAAVSGLAIQPAHAGAVIKTGNIALGVNNQGHLNYTDGVTTTTNGAGGAVGVAIYFPDGSLRDATAPGCLCEGWGAGVNSTNTGYADISSGGISNLTVDSFTSTASTATSIVHLTNLPGFSVKQEYFPSASSALFENKVTITNTTGATLTDVRYTRAMDWDVPPTEFNEYVTIGGLPATAVLHSNDNGFEVPNPFRAYSDYGCGTTVNFTDCGPSDHGAVFDFGFGSLADGASHSFSIFYGATYNEKDAFAALGTVGAEVYSLGESNTIGGPTLGTPATFIFAFKGVGGTALPPPETGVVPEPMSLFLLGSGLVGLVARRKIA